MKQTKKYLAFFAVLVLVATLFSVGAFALAGENNVHEELISEFGEEYFINLEQARANDANLMSFFARNRLGDRIYPDFYGGVYYNDDGNMVLLIVEEAASQGSAQYNLVRNFVIEENIIVEYVEFSYTEVNAVMDTLDTMFLSDDRPEAFENVTSHALDTKNNTVEVRLLVYSEEEITRFRETVLNSPILTFVESDGFGEFLSGGQGFTILQLNLLVIVGIGLLGMLAGFLIWKRKHSVLAMQTADSGVFAGSVRVTRKQVVETAKNRERVPKARDDLFPSIVKKIEETDS